jgi:hypothetical protein
VNETKPWAESHGYLSTATNHPHHPPASSAHIYINKILVPQLDHFHAPPN